MSRVQLGGSIQNNMLYNSYVLERKDEGLNYVPQREFTDTAQRLFPNLKRIKKKCSDKSVITTFNGICLKPLGPLICDSNQPIIDQESILNNFPTDFITRKIDSGSVICEIESNYTSNGNNILKTVTLNCDHTFEVKIANHVVDLTSIGIDNKFSVTQESIHNILQTISKIRLCEGVSVSKDIVCTRFHMLEHLKNKSNGKFSRQLRSVLCSRALKFNALSNICQTCQRMTRYLKTSEDKENEKPKIKAPSQITKAAINELLPNAPENMIELLLSQFQNAGVHPKGRRWSKEVLNSCLQIYTRSPVVYRQIRDSKLLVLPSTSFLLTYKNKVKHDTGFHDKIFRWMHEEARRINLPDQGMTGGIIIDEMSIQQNLEILKNGDIVELVGFEDMGEEGSMCATLRKGHQEKVLGTHILQFMFLGITGFRFPFAHFVSTNVQSYDLHRLFWEAVTWLKMYGFSARYISLDGAQSNRTFMNMNIGKNPSSMVCENPSPYDPSVVFIMDPKHVIKKIRNNVIKSGNTDGSTRLLTLPNGSTIQWKMWVNAFEWDRSNALQLHQRLTQEHIFPNSQAKMRNKLAEDVLNLEMLNLMVQYRASLTNSTVLDGAVEFLKNTSKIISIFQDKTPVLSSFDERLNTLIDISKWFDSWSEGHQQKDKNKLLISSQCLEDIKSCLIGFVELCKLVLVKKEYRIVPAMINSDIIENHFCQHRATYNGANSNPTALQYRRNLNSIILGQNIVSQKSNAGILAAHATKLSFTNTHKRPRAESTCKSDFKNLKIIRM